MSRRHFFKKTRTCGSRKGREFRTPRSLLRTLWTKLSPNHIRTSCQVNSDFRNRAHSVASPSTSDLYIHLHCFPRRNLFRPHRLGRTKLIHTSRRSLLRGAPNSVVPISPCTNNVCRSRIADRAVNPLVQPVNTYAAIGEVIVAFTMVNSVAALQRAAIVAKSVRHQIGRK